MNPLSSHMPPGPNSVAIPRPQVSIERLPGRRQLNEPRESMNCKSCRKRKIKCNRLRPACEACQIFQCPCIYDAVPKKRGPKTDVLEALLKRVDGLEAKLKDKSVLGSSSRPVDAAPDEASQEAESNEAGTAEPPPKRIATDAESSPVDNQVSGALPPMLAVPRQALASPVHTDALVHTYFARFHGKPYYILDESSVRQRMQAGQLPDYLCYAIWAVAARHISHPHGHQAAVKLSNNYAARARRSVDIDEPSMDALQALLLLVLAFVASGKGRKAHMLLTGAIGMASALELHREVVEAQALITPAQRELRRRLFWSCYLLDRFLACGSKRPSLIRDKSIALRLPSWCPAPSSPPVEGEFFHRGSNLQYFQGAGKKSQGSTGMLIDMTRILGITNKYLAAGGVKGDSHFPWHSLSTLSKIRQELDFWASGTDDLFAALHALIRQPDSTVLMLGKLIYHLVHCLVYRPFLPVDLAELSGNGQHQSWQIEATNMCFLHANAIAELMDFSGQAGTIEWPAFVGYCICTAATVHIHGAHYTSPGPSGEMSAMTSSADLLSREMQQLGELEYVWANVSDQRKTLQAIYNAHGELVRMLAGDPMRYIPSFHLEDFFDRYANIGGPGGKTFRFDLAHLSLSDTADSVFGSQAGTKLPMAMERPDLKTHTTPQKPSQPGGAARRGMEAQEPGLPSPPRLGTASSYRTASLHAAPGATAPLQPHAKRAEQHQYTVSTRSTMDHAAPSSTADAASDQASGYSMPPAMPGTAGQGLSALAETGFGQYGYGSGPALNSRGNEAMDNGGSSYDAMFGPLPTCFSSHGAWHDEDSQQRNRMNLLNSGVVLPSPGTNSAHGSTGTTQQTDDKDPFLSLLEQLAEDEQRLSNGSGCELDVFLTGAGGAS